MGVENMIWGLSESRDRLTRSFPFFSFLFFSSLFYSFLFFFFQSALVHRLWTRSC